MRGAVPRRVCITAYSTKDLIEMISRMPENKLTDEFWKILAKLVTVKNRPNYCSKELWKKIESYRTL